MELNKLTIAQAHQGLVKKEFSAKELTKTFLDTIKENDKDISAYVTITENLSLSKYSTGSIKHSAKLRSPPIKPLEQTKFKLSLLAL